jgi:hypothetical protein
MEAELRLVFASTEPARAVDALRAFVRGDAELEARLVELEDRLGRLGDDPAYRVTVEKREGQTLRWQLVRLNEWSKQPAKDALERPVMPEMIEAPAHQKPVTDDEAAAASPSRVY